MTDREHPRTLDGYQDGAIYPGPTGRLWRCVRAGDVVDFAPLEAPDSWGDNLDRIEREMGEVEARLRRNLAQQGYELLSRTFEVNGEVRTVYGLRWPDGREEWPGA